LLSTDGASRHRNVPFRNTNRQVKGRAIAHNDDLKQAKFVIGMKYLGKLCSKRHDTPSEASLTGKAYLQANVQNIKNQENPVVCREKADTEAYVGGSKPLNRLQMIDF